MDDIERELARIERGTERIISKEELRERLLSARKDRRPLRVKLGIDPTASDIHLGFAVVLRMLRRFQDLGHKAVLIIGDATAQVGDPSGKSSTRPILTREQVDANARSYIEQMGRILVIDDPAKFEVVRNGDWFGPMPFMEVVRLCSKYTVQRLLERNDFTNRVRAQQPLYLHEMIYPLMQGWDSVMVGSDVELGGTDQEFNLLVGRDLQEKQGQPRQICVMTPIVEGTDGVQKMSKSLGNYIGIAEPAQAQMNKTMQVPDAIMERWFRYFTDVPEEEYKALLASGNPRDAKRRLGRAIVELYHGADAAAKADDEWMRTVSAGELPERIPDSAPLAPLLSKDGKIAVVRLLKEVLGFAPSNSEARRLVEGGGVEIDGKRVDDPRAEVAPRGGEILRAGKKRYARLKL